jgi:hypothetical protein
VKSQWTSKGSWILAATEEDVIVPDYHVVGRKQRPTPELEKVLVAVRLAENN